MNHLTTDAHLASHATFVRNLAHALLADPGAADDVAQLALVQLWRRPPRVAAAVRQWLAQVVRRLAGRAARARERSRRREATAIPEVTAAEPIAGLLRAETLQAVADAVAALRPPLRDVVLLRYHENLRPRHVAARLSLSVAAVESRLRRAHLELALRLQQRLPDERWRHGLLLLVGPAWSLSLPVGVAMVAKSKLVLAAVPLVLLLAGSLWLEWPADRSPPPAPAADGDAVARPPRAADAPTVARTERTADAPVRPAAPAAAVVLLSGRVVDSRRRPVVGAEVRLGDAPALAAVRSEAGGTFTMAVPRQRGPRRGEVVAVAGDQVGVRAFAVDAAAATADLGVVVVGPSGQLRVRVLRNGRAEASARVIGQRVAGGTATTTSTDERGEALLSPLCVERHLLRVRAADGRQAVGLGDAFPHNEQVVAIDLDAAVALRVVALQTGSRRPLAGLFVATWMEVPTEGGGVAYAPLFAADAPAQTGADGTVTVGGLRPGRALRIAVRRTPEGLLAVEPPAARAFTPSRDGDTIEFEVDGPGELWFALQASHEVAPADGDAFDVSTFPGVSCGTATVREQRLVFAGEPPPPGTEWFARDGARCGRLQFTGAAQARQPGPAGNPVGFQRLRTCTVTLTDPAGRPLRGLPVCLRSGSPAQPGALTHRTDERGIATFAGLPAVPVVATLDADPDATTGSEPPLGAADLQSADGAIAAVLPTAVRVRAQVFLDGERALPGELTLGCLNGFVGEPIEDVDGGALQFDLFPHDPTAPCELRLFGSWRHSVGTATVAAGDTAPFVEFRLRRHHEAVAEVVPPPDGESQLFVERVFGPGPGQTSIWTHVPAGRQDDALPRFTNLAAGRYRLRDALSEVTGPEVEVDGNGVARLGLDLSRVVAVTGRVAPVSGDLPRDTLLEVSDAAGNVLRRSMLRADGAFTLRLAIDRGDLRLAAVAGPRRSAPLPLGGPMQDVLLSLP